MEGTCLFFVVTKTFWVAYWNKGRVCIQVFMGQITSSNGPPGKWKCRIICTKIPGGNKPTRWAPKSNRYKWSEIASIDDRKWINGFFTAVISPYIPGVSYFTPFTTNRLGGPASQVGSSVNNLEFEGRRGGPHGPHVALSCKGFSNRIL